MAKIKVVNYVNLYFKEYKYKNDAYLINEKISRLQFNMGRLQVIHLTCNCGLPNLGF